ncbi:MAG: DsbA family oxidoreductase [Candidatus Methylomirabilales bacterium]
MAEVRLDAVLTRLARRLPIRRVGYILKPEAPAYPSFSSERRGHWQRAAAAEPSLGIRLWVKGERYPGSSVPALEAAQAARRQGADASEAFHFGVFRAFLVENRDISDRTVLEEVALSCGLDLHRFRVDLKDPTVKEMVYAEHLEAVDRYHVEAVPTIVIGEERIEGAAPPAIYQAALAGLL